MLDPLQAENAVAGAILVDSACLEAITPLVAAGDFQSEANRRLYTAALDLHSRGDPVDAVTLRAALGDSVPPEYLLQLMEITPTAANARVYAQETRQAAMRRALTELAQALERDAAGAGDPQALIAQASRALEDVAARDTPRGLATSAQTMERFYQHRAQVDAGEGGFLTTGLRALDQMLGGGLLNSGLYVLAARPGMGKTALALQIADHMAQNHGGVLYISLEMDLEQIAARRLARLIRMPVHRLLMDRLDEQTCARMAQAAGQLSQLPLYLNRQSWAGVDQVEQLARQVPGLRCIVIDYFGLLRPAEGKGSRYEAMTQISGALKALARSRGVPVLCLAQLNRELTQRRDCRPKLSDLRDTGALEQDADGVILLHREDYYQDGPAPDPCLLDLILAKNRHGPTGECQMAFYLAQGRAAPTMVRRGVEG